MTLGIVKICIGSRTTDIFNFNIICIFVRIAHKVYSPNCVMCICYTAKTDKKYAFTEMFDHAIMCLKCTLR